MTIGSDLESEMRETFRAEFGATDYRTGYSTHKAKTPISPKVQIIIIIVVCQTKHFQLDI